MYLSVTLFPFIYFKTETIFDLCEEDKKEYNYDMEEKKSRMKKKSQTNKTKEKIGENKNIYADITTYFKKI